MKVKCAHCGREAEDAHICMAAAFDWAEADPETPTMEGVCELMDEQEPA